MSLYGLDVVTDATGRDFLIEINGCKSGVTGFRAVYGDNRVEKQIADMLRKKYGEVFIDDGSYALALRQQFMDVYPVRHDFLSPLFAALVKLRLIRPEPIESKKAEKEWLREACLDKHDSQLYSCCIDIFDGQPGVTHMNWYNSSGVDRTVNSYIAEEITRNKLLFHALMKGTPSADLLPDTTPVGIGITDERELGVMLDKYDAFVLKPIMGSGGCGVRILAKDRAARYRNSRGPVFEPGVLDFYMGMHDWMRIIHGGLTHVKYAEDYVSESDFRFESGVAVLQPFIDSRNENGEYTSTRVIVCNGEFVDAYDRVGKTPVVNMAKGAAARKSAKKRLKKMSEEIVAEFESRCETCSAETYRKDLYGSFFQRRGYTGEAQRTIDRMTGSARAARQLLHTATSLTDKALS